MSDHKLKPENVAVQQPSGGSPVGSSGAGVLVGKIEPVAQPGFFVSFEGSNGPCQARTTLVLTSEHLGRAIVEEQGALIVLEGGNPAAPIVVGLLQDPPLSPFGQILEGMAPKPETAPSRPLPVVRVDGRRVTIEASQILELRCGEASIVLTADGKVLTRGKYVESFSKGVSRIKGGTLKLN